MKNWQTSIFAAAIVFATSCVERADPPLFSDEKTAQIMADLAVADAAAMSKFTGYPRDSITEAYFSQVFQMHGVSKEDYEKNLLLLSHDLDRLQRCSKNAEQILQKKLDGK